MEQGNQEITATVPVKQGNRPVLLTLFCLASFVFFGLLILIFLGVLIFGNYIIGLTNQYIPENMYTKSGFRLLFSTGLVLHMAAFTGVVMIWRLKKTGYYLVTASCLIISSYQLFQPQFSAIATFVYISILMAFGLFFKRLT